MTIDISIEEVFKKIRKEITDISFLGKGEASNVYKIVTTDDIYVLKTALYPERKVKVLKEAKIRNFFIDKGLTCIPEPIYSDEDIFSNGAVIYRFVDGSKPNFENTETIKQMAKLVSSIHQIEYSVQEEGLSNVNKLAMFLEQTIVKIKTKYPHLITNETDIALDFALYEFKKMISGHNNSTFLGINALLHGDLSNNFVIDTNKKIWLIDWENSEYGDIVEEISWFLAVNELNLNQRAIFFEEYQKYFPLTKDIEFESLYQLYSASTPVFNICWGIDQLDMNIRQNLEPERKIRDLLETATEWRAFYSESISDKIMDGINSLAQNYVRSSKEKKL